MRVKKAKMALGILFVTSLVFTSVPTITWGKEKPRVIAIMNSLGLEVKVPHKTVDLANLNPGDSKATSLQVSNKGLNEIMVFIRTNILEETTLRGGYLADKVNFSIKEEGNILADDVLRGVGNMGNILIGTLKPGDSKTLDFSSYLPGTETGNEYQGAYMRVSWTFVVQQSRINAPSGGLGTDVNPGLTKNPDLPGALDGLVEEFTIEDELVPLASDAPLIKEDLPMPDSSQVTTEDKERPDDLGITVKDQEIPFGGFKLPKTGQFGAGIFYGAGSCLILLGLYSKKHQQFK